MKLLIAKSPWEIYSDPLEHCLARIVEAGFDAVEIDLFDRPESLPIMRSCLQQTGLPVIVQINSRGSTVEEQLRSLERRYEHGLFASPLFFNCHTGKDHFSYEENLRIFERAGELSARHGISILHETHRGCALCNGPVIARYLRELPDMRVTADLSHLFCVHESDLSDQPSALDLILNRADHVHARVGFAEGPQVSDPRNPLHEYWVNRCFELWQRICRRALNDAHERFTFTPEFGPVGYMPLRGVEPEPVADAWEINLWMRDELRRRFTSLQP